MENTEQVNGAIDLQMIGNEITMTSREFAELSNREHKDIALSIESLNVHLEEMSKGRVPSQIYISRWKEFTEYILTKEHATLIAMKMDTKVMIRVHDKFMELQKPKSWYELALESMKFLTAEVQKEKEKNLLLEEKITKDAPLVEFASIATNIRGWILIRNFAKVIESQLWVKVGQNKLFAWFRRNKVLTANNLPYQSHMKYFTVSEHAHHTDLWNAITFTARINGKWQAHFLSKIKNGRRLAI